VAARYRQAHCDRLRRLLAPLSREERQRLLVPLAEERAGDACAIAAALLREPGVAAEVSPAAPNARGDEASPAEGPT
jgi:hypothetical protein